MTRRQQRTGPAKVGLALLVLIAAAACGTASNAGRQSEAHDRAVVVASFNFTESELLADIYAGALERAGIPVRRELDLGPRELVDPALAQGLVDVVPEYLGTALRFAAPAAHVDASDPVAVRAALSRAIARWHVSVLQPAAAQDQNGLALTRARADALRVRSVSDLRRYRDLVLGGPPECPTRDFCLVGLRRVYGLHFRRFIPLDNQEQEQTALEQGVIDVAVMFTTDAHVADPSLVLLDDDRHLQPAENVVPVVSTRALRDNGAIVTSVLDRVSAQLTSQALTFLNWRVDVAGKVVADEAAGWLARHP